MQRGHRPSPLLTETKPGFKPRARAVSVEPKIDGVALSIMYRGGKLAYAATRGDGDVGDCLLYTSRCV